jgi:hypothetical protein
VMASLCPTVASKINYQGRLTDPGGLPLSGNFQMRLQIYNDPVAGALRSDSGFVVVSVDHGLFNAELRVDQADFTTRGSGSASAWKASGSRPGKSC